MEGSKTSVWGGIGEYVEPLPLGELTVVYVYAIVLQNVDGIRHVARNQHDSESPPPADLAAQTPCSSGIQTIEHIFRFDS